MYNCCRKEGMDLALFFEVSPKVRLVFAQDGAVSKEIILRSGVVADALKRWMSPSRLYVACDSRMGSILVQTLRRNGYDVVHIPVQDELPIDVRIEDVRGIHAGSSPEQRLAYEDRMAIRSNFVSALLDMKTAVFPCDAASREFIPELLKVTSQYYRKSVVYGPESVKALPLEPDYAVITEEDLAGICPFRIESRAQLRAYAQHYVESRKTKIAVLCQKELLFAGSEQMLSVSGDRFRLDTLLAGLIFAIDHDLPSARFLPFTAAAASSSPYTPISKIAESEKNIHPVHIR